MEIPVHFELLSGSSFRASCQQPFEASAEGPTRELALERLRTAVMARLPNVEDAEFVQMTVPAERSQWPDHELTRHWSEAMRSARQTVIHQPRWDSEW